MWFYGQVLLPRIVRSIACMIAIQECFLSCLFLLFKMLCGDPVSGITDGFIFLSHWKTILYHCILSASTVAFALLNKHYYRAEKHVSSTRFEKICQAFSAQSIQHFTITAFLGGLISHFLIRFILSLNSESSSFLISFLSISSEFEHIFIVLHGCFTGIMFSLKYFICHMYIIKFNLSQETKRQQLQRLAPDVMKDSLLCVLRSMHWFYLLFVLFGPVIENFFMAIGIQISEREGYLSLVYSLINIKLFIVTLFTGFIIFFTWSLYLSIFNIFLAERHTFPIQVPLKTEKVKNLEAALQNTESDIIKYLAVLDLRLLAQSDPLRRNQLFSISHPGGHPHHWKAVSDYCILNLKQLVKELQSYTVVAAAKSSNTLMNKGPYFVLDSRNVVKMQEKIPNIVEELCLEIKKWPAVIYFSEELPGTKMKKLFLSSQPLIWIVEALGFLVSASYTEDKFGVVQQSLPEIIRILLDIKMAEEKLPIDVVGIRTHVKDPYGRYEHIHQRVALKSSVNFSLCRIADTFKDDISGIYLPDEYSRYFQRYTSRRNV